VAVVFVPSLFIFYKYKHVFSGDSVNRLHCEQKCFNARRVCLAKPSGSRDLLHHSYCLNSAMPSGWIHSIRSGEATGNTPSFIVQCASK